MKDIQTLVTGAGGLLGGAFMALAKKGHIQGLSTSDLDICDFNACNHIIKDAKPDVIIHCAAKTNVEWCEKHKVEAEAVNVQGTINLIEAAKKVRAKIVLISSTGVYGAHKDSAYTERDMTKPTTWHHETKLMAEFQVQMSGLPYLIIRTGWLFGSYNAKTDYVLDRIRDAYTAKFLSSNISQIGNPTYTKSLVEQVLLLLKMQKIGIFNCVNIAAGITRYEYTRKILASASCNKEVRPVEGSFFNRVASVSNNESAINEKLLLQSQNLMPSWDLALETYIKERLAL
jgi:dTDP-4-dehydrorhamnose reductase